MILIEKPERFAEFKEVTGDDLYFETQNGWTVVAMLQGGQIDTRSQSRPRYDREGYQTGSDYIDQSYVLPQPRYLIGKTRDKVIEDLRKDRTDLNEESARLQREKKESTSKIGELEEQLSQQKADNESANEYSRKYRSEKEEAQKLCRKMEEDLAKLRQAVGDIKFKEIVECQ